MHLTIITVNVKIFLIGSLTTHFAIIKRFSGSSKESIYMCNDPHFLNTSMDMLVIDATQDECNVYIYSCHCSNLIA